MSLWIVGPTNGQSSIWNIYRAKRFLVEAETEEDARTKAAETAAAVAVPNPWLDASQSTCEPIASPAEVLGRGSKKNAGRRPARRC